METANRPMLQGYRGQYARRAGWPLDPEKPKDMNRAIGWIGLMAVAAVGFAADEKVPVLAAGPESVQVPAMDLAKALAEDEMADAKGNPGGWRYALPYETSINPRTHGKWARTRSGKMRWVYDVSAPDAVHLNFGFTQYWLPEGAELRFESIEGEPLLRPFTSADNESHRQLWTPPMEPKQIRIIVEANANSYDQVELKLGRINQGYRGFNYPGKVCKSGSCNTDVTCLADNDPWNRERRAVGVISFSGSRDCTGSLVNNTSGNRRMLFATASHCQVTANVAPTIAVIWNYDAASCRRPGSAASGVAANGPFSQFHTGARLLAATPAMDSGQLTASVRSDFTLVELDDPAVPGFNLYWAGWDRRNVAPTCSVPATASATAGLCASIHHPNGDEKRITFSEQNMFSANYVANGTTIASGVHWQVQWDSTIPQLAKFPGSGTLPPSVTEPGSSGSPLYNANHHLVGVLSGGASQCGASTANLNDLYGKLTHAWEGLGTNTTRVRDYLDPGNTGAQTLDGLDTSGTACGSFSATMTGATSGSVDTPIDFQIAISGGTAPFLVRWDVDDDGVTDRTAAIAAGPTSLAPRYVRPTSTTVKATIQDAANCTVEVSRAINVSGPDIVVAESPPVQTCGDNDAFLEPGERWSIPVSALNSGGNAVDNGVFVFASGSISDTVDLSNTADSFGYTRADNSSAVCRFQTIDLGAAPNLPLVAASNTPAEDDGAAVGLALGPTPFNLYGRNISSVIMSTNGYLATAQDDGGGEFANSCGLYSTGPENAYLQALHDDLVIQTGGGLRRAYFGTCPRASDAGSPTQGCTVFEWRNVGRYAGSGSTPVGNAVIQAILYDQSFEIVYQYVTALNDNGQSATIGIQDFNTTARNEYACNTASAPNNRSVCFFHPSAQPGSGSSTSSLVIDGRPFLRSSSLASGATLQGTIPVQIPTNATCGTPLTASYLGMVDDKSFSARSKNILSTTVGGGSSCNTSACGTTFAPRTLPRSGLYQNLNRLGSGTAAFNIPRDADTQFASVWYTAKADRSPYWYTLGGIWNGLRTQVSTDLTETRRTSTSPFGVSRSSVGNAWVTWLDDTNEYAYFWNLDGTMVGEKEARFVEETGFTGDTNRSGGWFNPSEDGWGVTVTDFRAGSSNVRGLLAFVFDDDGEPRWSTGSLVNQTTGPIPATIAYTHCPTCPNFADFNNTSVGTGTMQMSFTGATSSTFTSSLIFPTGIDGSWSRQATPMILITPPFQP